MAAASAATGFRSWLQTHSINWLTPRRMRALTIGAMSAAAIASTIGFSGSSAPIGAHSRPAASAPAGHTR